MSEIKACRFVVKGRVQGVGFRYFALREAQRLGLGGWVRNLVNGDVEVHAEGAEEDIATLRGKLQKGPSFSWVTEVLESPGPQEGHGSFRIRH